MKKFNFFFKGMGFVKLCGIKEYDWFGRLGKKSIKDWKIFNWYLKKLFFLF